ncbi:hypothetical protein F5141DRAFT_1065915 [Pisolithus sp. B1]|nr:hypothetical protein F5141DRAFT_1065915 [Pisolithus sp. B1]
MEVDPSTSRHSTQPLLKKFTRLSLGHTSIPSVPRAPDSIVGPHYQRCQITSSPLPGTSPPHKASEPEKAHGQTRDKVTVGELVQGGLVNISLCTRMTSVMKSKLFVCNWCSVHLLVQMTILRHTKSEMESLKDLSVPDSIAMERASDVLTHFQAVTGSMRDTMRGNENVIYETLKYPAVYVSIFANIVLGLRKELCCFALDFGTRIVPIGTEPSLQRNASCLGLKMESNRKSEAETLAVLVRWERHG